MPKSTTWRFGGFVYNSSSGLSLGGNSIRLARKERALLELLLRANGTLVSKDQLIHDIWGDGPITDESLSRCAYMLRRALQRQDGPDIVKTVYGGGLRICVPVREGTENTQENPFALPATSSQASARLWRMGWEQAGARSRDGLESAQLMFQRAYDEDPTSLAIPLTMLALRIVQANRGYLTSTAAGKAAGEIISKVAQNNPRYPPVVACQAWFRAVVDRQLSAALAELDWAVQAMPQDYHAGLCRAWVLSGMGRLDEALRELERGVDVMFPDRGYTATYAWMLFCARRFDEAENHAQQAVQQRPENDRLHTIISSIHALRGNTDEAIESAARAIKCLDNEPTTEAPLAYAYAMAGRSNDAVGLIRKLSACNQLSGAFYLVAPVWLALGYPERALATLRDSDEKRESLFFFAQHDPRLEALGPLPPIQDAGQDSCRVGGSGRAVEISEA